MRRIAILAVLLSFLFCNAAGLHAQSTAYPTLAAIQDEIAKLPEDQRWPAGDNAFWRLSPDEKIKRLGLLLQEPPASTNNCLGLEKSERQELCVECQGSGKLRVLLAQELPPWRYRKRQNRC